MEERFKKLTKEKIIEIIKKEGKTKVFDLSWSDLSGSNLRGSNLRGSDLSGSDLRWSDLSGSDLSGSNLTKETTFSKIKITKSQSKIFLEKLFEIGEDLKKELKKGVKKK